MTEDGSQKPGLFRLIRREEEGRILLAGLGGVLLYVCGSLVIGIWWPGLCQGLLAMAGTHAIGGRAAAMTMGYEHELPGWGVMVATMVFESCLVCIFFGGFVLSYRHLVVVQPLQGAILRAQRVARVRQKAIMKYGIPGLLFFVWLPFWMTGPLVGSIIGYFIGLRPRVNLAVVLVATYAAIASWGPILKRLHSVLEGVGPWVPLVFVGVILLAAVSLHIRFAFSRRSGAGADEEREREPKDEEGNDGQRGRNDC